MQNALPGTFSRTTSPTDAAQARPSALSLITTLQATNHAFARYPLTILACAVLLIGGGGLIGSLLFGVLIGEAVLRTGTHTGVIVRVYNLQMLVQAVVGALTFFIGRGALTWIALHADDGTPITLRNAVREAVRRWQPLLASTVLYGAIITVGTFSLMLLLRELRLDVSNARWLRGDLDSILNWTVVRSIASLPPDPGSPFTEWIMSIKYNLSRSSSAGYFGFDYYSRYATGVAPLQLWALGFMAIVLLVVADILLCLRTAAVFAVNPAGGPVSSTSWLRAALQASAQQIGRVAALRWTLRLATTLIVAGALVLLPAIHQVTVMGGVRMLLGTGYWPAYIAQAGYGLVTAFIGSLLVAYGVIFEARMYAGISR